MDRYNIEHCTEYVKSWAACKREVKLFDQIYLFAKQQQSEYRLLSSGKVDHIVTDCPTFLSVIYAMKYCNEKMADAINQLNLLYESTYPSLNIFLERTDIPYTTPGRYQTKTEAIEIDHDIKNTFDHYAIPRPVSFKNNDIYPILEYVRSSI